MKHCEVGPSTLPRRAACRGSLLEERGLPEIPSEAAEEGTGNHEAVNTPIQMWQRGEPLLIPEDNEPVAECLRRFSRLIDAHAVTRTSDISVERPLRLYDENRLLTWGTCDLMIVLWDIKLIIIVDWKFGRQPLDPAYQVIQLVAYGEAALQEVRDDGSWRAECAMFWARLPFESCRVEVKRGSYLRDIRRVIEESYAGGELRAGPHCRWCKALGLCAETANEVRSVAELARLDLSRLNRNAVTELIRMVPRVEAAARAVKARARQILEDDPTALPNCSLRRRLGRRKIGLADAIEATRKIMSIEELLACCEVKVKDLEEAFLNKFGERDEGKAEWKALARQYVTQPTFMELRHVGPREGTASGGDRPEGGRDELEAPRADSPAHEAGERPAGDVEG